MENSNFLCSDIKLNWLFLGLLHKIIPKIVLKRKKIKLQLFLKLKTNLEKELKVASNWVG